MPGPARAGKTSAGSHRASPGAWTTQRTGIALAPRKDGSPAMPSRPTMPTSMPLPPRTTLIREITPLCGKSTRFRQKVEELHSGNALMAGLEWRPLHSRASLSGLPPLLLLVGQDELLLDDAVRVRDAATSVGTDVRVLIGKGMQHDWPLTLPWLDESRLAWNAMRRFVEEH